ncbi:MAG: hypothetical protein ACOC5T_01925 [Elusimicrobiota bacterium]
MSELNKKIDGWANFMKVSHDNCGDVIFIEEEWENAIGKLKEKLKDGDKDE